MLTLQLFAGPFTGDEALSLVIEASPQLRAVTLNAMGERVTELTLNLHCEHASSLRDLAAACLIAAAGLEAQPAA